MSKAPVKPPKVEKSYFVSSDGVKIAYNKLSGAEPGIIFFGGFASDMDILDLPEFNFTNPW